MHYVVAMWLVLKHMMTACPIVNTMRMVSCHKLVVKFEEVSLVSYNKVWYCCSFLIWIINESSINLAASFFSLHNKSSTLFFPPRSMYFHVHIISILAAVALHRKHKPREPTTKTSSVSSSAPCSAQCQHVHANNNDKDWKSHFAFFYQAFRTLSPLKDKWVSLGHSASLKWENIVLFIFWLYRVKEICTYGTGCVRGEPSPMIEAHQADTEEKPQLRKWFWYNHHHRDQNAGPNPLSPFTYSRSLQLFLPPWPSHQHQPASSNNNTTVWREYWDSLSFLSSICAVPLTGGISASTAGQQLINGPQIPGHMHTQTHA